MPRSLRVAVSLVGACLVVGVLASPALASSGWSAFVVNDDGQSATPFDTAANTPGTPIAIPEVEGEPSEPGAVAIAPDGKTAYVLNLNCSGLFGVVVPVDTATHTVGTGIDVGHEPVAIAIAPDGSTIYVANYAEDTVTVINTASDTVETTVPVGLGPDAIAVSPDGSTVFVANSEEESVTPIDTANNVAGTPIGVGADPDAIAITPDGSTIYVANFEADTITAITAGGTSTITLPTGSGPEGLAITPDGATLYAADASDDTVLPVNTATGVVGGPITVGEHPVSLAVTPDGRTVYAVNSIGDSVTPIDTSTNTPGPALTGFESPGGISISPDQAPSAGFTVSPAPAGTASTFDAAGSSSPVGSIATYAWEFGDGGSQTTTSPQTTHVYVAAGDYTARLTVTNLAGTSLTQVFTGQTVSREGGPQATVTQPVAVPAPVLPLTPQSSSSSSNSPSPSPPPPGPVAPTLSRLAMSPRKLQEGGSFGAKGKKGGAGTVISFTLNEGASVGLTVYQELPGKKVGRKCVASKGKPGSGTCTRMVARGALTVAGHAGTNTIRFTGTVSGRKLAPGRYSLVTTATASGLTSAQAPIGFVVAPR